MYYTTITLQPQQIFIGLIHLILIADYYLLIDHAFAPLFLNSTNQCTRCRFTRSRISSKLRACCATLCLTWDKRSSKRRYSVFKTEWQFLKVRTSRKLWKDFVSVRRGSKLREVLVDAKLVSCDIWMTPPPECSPGPILYPIFTDPIAQLHHIAESHCISSKSSTKSIKALSTVVEIHY